MSATGPGVEPVPARATTTGWLLDGRVRHDQFADGHRTGIEPVLLAAAVPARRGDRVLEAGSGSGAGLLCLAARVDGVIGVGVELDPAIAALARRNAAANGFHALDFVAGDVETATPDGPFDHAFANPPWHRPSGTASPDGGRDLARRARDATAAIWTRRLVRALRPGGTITLIVPASGWAPWTASLAAAGCGAVTLAPLWPRAGHPAKIVLLQARRGSASDDAVRAGLVLHRPDGPFTDAADAILRTGAAFPLRD